MRGVVPVIDQVIASIDQGQIEVANRQELREALLLLRRLAVERMSEDRMPPARSSARTVGTPENGKPLKDVRN